jgi:PAS domain S-box-containing protein
VVDSVVTLDKGRGAGHVGFNCDIIDPERSEEALRRTMEQLQIVTDAMAAPVTRCSRDLIYLWVSKPYADWINRPADEIIGRPILEVIGPEAFAHLRPRFEQVLSGQLVRYEEQVQFQGIGPRWISAVYTPTLGADGAPDGWVAVVTDVTERKRMEESLRESEAQFAAELEATTRLHAPGARLLLADKLRAALDDLLGTAMVTCAADFGNIQLYDQGTGVLEIVVQRGFQNEFLESFRKLPVGDGSAYALAIQRGERITIEDVNLDPDFEPHRQAALAAGYRAVQSTPLRSLGGTILGMLSTHFRTPHRPSDREQRLLDLYARHAADLIQCFRSQEALRQSEQRFVRFMDHLPGLAWIKDLQGRYVYANDAAIRVFRCTRDDLYSRTDEEVFPAETAARFKDNDRKALASETGVQVIETLEHQDGIVHHSFVSKFPISGSESGPAFIGGMAMDITDRLRAEKVLAESEERFRQLAENINEVFWMTDPQTTQLLYISPAYERVWGRSCQSLYDDPRSFMDAVHPDDRERVRIDVLERQSRGEQVDKEYRVVRPDGAIRWVRDRAFPVRNAAGEFYRLVGIIDDFTEKKRADDTIRSLLRISVKLNSTLDLDELLDLLVTESVGLVGAESGVSGLSSPAGMVCQRYFQKSKRVPLRDCWPPMHGLPGWLVVHKVPYLTNDALADPQIIHEFCVQFGVRSALSTPILNAQGEVLGFFEIHNKDGGFTPDDQEKLSAVSHAASIAIQNALAYRRAQEAEESLRDANRRKDEFLATLAHELRNPLAPIRTAAQVLRMKDLADPDLTSARDMIDRQVGQMVRLIDDLLDISRITSGKLRLRKECVDLHAVLQSAVEASRPLIDSQAHNLTVGLAPEPVHLDGDPMRLAQVFSNLLNNAAKYTEKGGHIWLTAERQGSEVVVSVRDTGIGIAAEHLPRLFEMFSQVEPAMERSHGGLGIGLALVRGLVELHGGSAVASSAGPGRGSEFTVRLPVVQAQTQACRRRSADDDMSCTKPKCRILVADDLRDAADSLAMMLRLAGHDTQTAHDGLEAVQAAATFRPDVVLLDLGMPTMNGYEAARHLRQQAWGKRMVLVAVTGWGQQDDRRRTAEAGFDYHIVKPVEPKALEELIDSLKQAGRKREG